MSEGKFKVYFENLNFADKIILCKNQAISLVKLRKRYEKALFAQQNYKGSFCGKGKGSTLFANCEKIAEQYQDQLDLFRYSSSLL